MLVYVVLSNYDESSRVVYAGNDYERANISAIAAARTLRQTGGDAKLEVWDNGELKDEKWFELVGGKMSVERRMPNE